MRYLDIAVAALVGTAAITGLSLWSPGAGDDAAHRFHSTSALRTEVAEFVQSKGVSWFLETSPQEVCAAMAAASNSTFTLGGDIGPTRCGLEPPAGSPSSRLTFVISQEVVTVVAWSGGGA